MNWHSRSTFYTFFSPETGSETLPHSPIVIKTCVYFLVMSEPLSRPKQYSFTRAGAMGLGPDLSPLWAKPGRYRCSVCWLTSWTDNLPSKRLTRQPSRLSHGENPVSCSAEMKMQKLSPVILPVPILSAVKSQMGRARCKCKAELHTSIRHKSHTA